MKTLTNSIVAPFALAMLATFLANNDTTALPKFFGDFLATYSDKKAAATSYPYWVFALLFAAAATESLSILGVTSKLLDTAFNKALNNLLKVGFGLLGVVAELTRALWFQGYTTQIYKGALLFLIVLFFVVTPVGLAFSVRSLNNPHKNPKHQKLMKHVTLIVCLVMCVISLYGIWKQFSG